MKGPLGAWSVRQNDIWLDAYYALASRLIGLEMARGREYGFEGVLSLCMQRGARNAWDVRTFFQEDSADYYAPYGACVSILQRAWPRPAGLNDPIVSCQILMHADVLP